ncbi:DEAD/DEAH box helicase [Rubellicoccus peritrichatus]|uniref:DEAD/DEAH box helicase n=1 Tax=Rubellicoccus peritrichatus TaxID=3080537 RepID=A0AAQ3L5N7_9BACT|nr:DEAD/DEAH box helicase [Puniceicoccus sp. CR14]WOO39665.1 DEAD/DEAH box helicase [Puniceicoccus sp. CR14]
MGLNAQDKDEATDQSTMPTFSTLGISDEIVTALAQQKITTPLDIQSKAYPVISGKQDAWLRSPTGSGKTLAYLLPLLRNIDTTTTDLQVAILAPTQELAVQIHECIRLLSCDGTSALRSQLLIGSASSQRQKEKLKKKPHIVVGSCGRMLELNRAGKLKLHKCNAIAIDEADNMLAEDSVEAVEKFIKATPSSRQLVFISATEKGDAFRVAQTLGKNVQWIESENNQTSPTTIEHFYIESSFRHKADTLRKLLNAVQPDRAIVFLHRNATAELVGEKLSHKELKLMVLHGGMSKFERQKALGDFRKGKIKVLVSSDVSARGLDVKDVTHIINLDLPSDSGDYLHRVGRTGRMGATGAGISIATYDEMRLIDRYERDLGITIHHATLRNGQFLVPQ